MNTRKVFAKLLLAPAFALAFLSAPAAWAGGYGDFSRLASPEARAEAAELSARIAGAKSVEEARALALAETGAARDALAVAEAFVSDSDKIALAHARLDAFASRVNEAETAAAVAAEFEALPAAYGPNVLATGGSDCNYTNTETIVIVIGLIFGIIPGLIDMWLLC